MSEPEWSDSDGGFPDSVHGNVLLGLPDGVVTEAADLADPAVSRLGGVPVSAIWLDLVLASLKVQCLTGFPPVGSESIL